MPKIFESGFDAANHEPKYESLPDGTYNFVVTGATLKEWQGSYNLEVTYSVLTGPEEGRLFFDKFTVAHPDPKRVEMGLGKLARLCTAVGLDGKELSELDTDDVGQEINYFDGKRLSVELETKPSKSDPSKSYQNTKSYKPITATQAATKAAPASPAAQEKKRPWAK